MLDGTGLHTVPVLHRGPATAEELRALIGPSAFDSAFDNPATGKTDHLMEGLYARTEAGGFVTGRAKMVRPEFVEKVKQSEHWQHQAMVANQLAEGVKPSQSIARVAEIANAPKNGWTPSSSLAHCVLPSLLAMKKKSALKRTTPLYRQKTPRRNNPLSRKAPLRRDSSDAGSYSLREDSAEHLTSPRAALRRTFRWRWRARACRVERWLRARCSARIQS